MEATSTIVLVDDTAANRQLVGYWLRNAGFRVLEADRGDDGLELVEAELPDLVVLDVHLPGLDGLEVCRRMRTNPTTTAIPILQVSAAATESSDRIEGLERGADAYLVMPVPAPEFLAVVRSLLRMRRAEEAAVAQAERWEAAFENAATGMALFDPQTLRFLRVNEVLCHMLDRTEQELLSLTSLAVTHPDDVDATERALDAIISGDETSTLLEKRYRTASGRTVWVLASHTLVRDRSGDPLHVVLNAQDITERRLAIEELEAARLTAQRAEAEVRFRALVDAAPDGIVVVDDTGSIKIVNREIESMFGYDREELLGHTLETLLPARFHDVHAGHRAGYVKDPRMRRMGVGLELTALRKDGSEFPVDVKLSPLDTDEGLLVSASVRDATERKQVEADRERLEERLRRSERLESLGQLAGGVAHDFNNLLAVILNYAGFVQETLEPDSAAAEDLGEIRRAAERAAALTHQLLIFGRREVINPEVLDLNHVTTDLQQFLSRTIGENIELRTALGDDLWPIRVDRSGIEQVLMNLLVNARDAMPDGGTILVETENADLTSADAAAFSDVPQGRYVLISVTDTGAGMDATVAGKAFEPFFTTKPRGHGTGLGLATVYGVVTQSGGEVHLYSEPERGTVARVYLPAAGSEAIADERPVVQAAPPVSGVTILVVEDEDAVRELTRRVLAKRGYDVITAQDGADALAICDRLSAPVSLVLTDVVMPKVSGRELVERLRGRAPGVRVLFMSGYPQEVMADGEFDLANFITKPFDADSLARRVEEVLAGPARTGQRT